MAVVRITNNDVLLMAASRLPRTFTEEDLGVTAWSVNSRRFGMAGFEDKYVDNHKIKCCLMGKKGLVGRKKLVRVKVGVYSLP